VVMGAGGRRRAARIYALAVEKHWLIYPINFIATVTVAGLQLFLAWPIPSCCRPKPVLAGQNEHGRATVCRFG